MIDKNPQALALAFKKCKGKIMKIKELGINSKMDDDAIEALIEKLAQTKADEDNSSISEHVKGQRWYVEGLVTFSGLGGDDIKPEDRAKLQLDQEYQDAFADSASEAEMLESISAMAA